MKIYLFHSLNLTHTHTHIYIYIIQQVTIPNTFYFEQIKTKWLPMLRKKGKDKTNALTAIGRWKGNHLDFKTILLIINIPNSHWYIVRVDTIEREFNFYDSMFPSGFSDQHKQVVKDLKEFFILSGNKNVAEDEERPWRSKNMSSPQQYGEIDGEKNGLGKDCALFVILYIARYLAKESIDYTQDYIRTNKIREKIFTNLFHKDFTKEKL